MEPMKESSGALDRLLGHGDAPSPISLPLAAWAVAVAGDALALATGLPAFDAASRVAIGAGLVGTAGAMATGVIEGGGGGEGASARGHEGAVAAHVATAVAVGGLFVASFVLRAVARDRGRRPSALARGLSIAGAGVALANATLIHSLMPQAITPAQGRARLDPASPLGMHAS